jgi:hypothetical protein
MKSFILSIYFLAACANFAFGKCAPQAFYTTVHNTPVMVYGTISNCKTDKKTGMATAVLQIIETLKGELSEGKMIVRQLNVSFASEIGGSVPQKADVKNGDKKIFFLERNPDKSWRLVTGRCMTYQLAVNAKKEIILSNFGNKTVSFDDFKNGITLFNKNYSDFESQKAKSADFKLENTTKNTTFALLAGEMFGKPFETAETTEKPAEKVKTKKGKRGKRKK